MSEDSLHQSLLHESRSVGALQDDPRTQKIFLAKNPLTIEDSSAGDIYSMLALVAGIVGLLMRYKIAAWFAVIFSLISISNMKKGEIDWKQVFASSSFSIMGLAMNYFGPQTKI